MTDRPEPDPLNDGTANDSSASPAPTAPKDQPRDPHSGGPSLDDIDREVADAMGAMAPEDVAELCGKTEIHATGDTIAPDTELVGTVRGVSDDDIFLEFGVKSQGVLPRLQFGKKETIEIGRRVDVVVERYDESTGLLIVNRKGAIQRATWTNLAVGMLTQGRVTGVIKGGLEIDLHGVRAFMPASHVDLVPMKDISVFLNETVKCVVLEVDRRHKNVLLSRRKAMEKDLAESREKLKAELAEGQIRPGVVRTITDFGAFVDLGGVDGLLHIRDLSWGTVEKVTDVLSLGQKVEVMVLKIDAPRDRISLGLKQSLPDPWAAAPDKYPVGTALKVRVIRLADFGAFAELEPGIEGLIPISEIGWSRTQKTSDHLAPGDVVDCVVIRLEPDRHRLALSIKQAQPDPWAEVFESFPAQSLAKGKVTRLTDFGAFVELVPGVEGLIHISEMADRRISTCAEVVQVGQEVETRVLGVDPESRRISLSIKAVSTSMSASAESPADEGPAKPKKKRTKPLRGGLSSHFDW